MGSRLNFGVTKESGSRSGWEATPEMVIVRRRNLVLSVQDPEYGGTRETRRNPRGPSRKAKYSLVTDSEPVP